MSSRPSVQVPRVRKRPLQKQQQQQQKRKRQRLGGNLPRRRIDPGKSRNFLGDLMDMDILGKEFKGDKDQQAFPVHYRLDNRKGSFF